MHCHYWECSFPSQYQAFDTALLCQRIYSILHCWCLPGRNYPQNYGDIRSSSILFHFHIIVRDTSNNWACLFDISDIRPQWKSTDLCTEGPRFNHAWNPEKLWPVNLDNTELNGPIVWLRIGVMDSVVPSGCVIVWLPQMDKEEEPMEGWKAGTKTWRREVLCFCLWMSKREKQMGQLSPLPLQGVPSLRERAGLQAVKERGRTGGDGSGAGGRWTGHGLVTENKVPPSLVGSNAPRESTCLQSRPTEQECVMRKLSLPRL